MHFVVSVQRVDTCMYLHYPDAARACGCQTWLGCSWTQEYVVFYMVLFGRCSSVATFIRNMTLT